MVRQHPDNRSETFFLLFLLLECSSFHAVCQDGKIVVCTGNVTAGQDNVRYHPHHLPQNATLRRVCVGTGSSAAHSVSLVLWW